jgi:hypothetical protein
MGYGWQDIHINKLIFSAAKNSNLKIYNVNVVKPEVLIRSAPPNLNLMQYLLGHTTSPLQEFMPSSAGATADYDAMIQLFFGV